MKQDVRPAVRVCGDLSALKNRCAQKLPACYGASAMVNYTGNAFIHAQGRLFELRVVDTAVKIKELKFSGTHERLA